MHRGRSAWIAVVALAGCGGGGQMSSAGSCTDTTSSLSDTCTDYGNGWTSAQVMQMCSGSGSYSMTPCPTLNRVGHCGTTLVQGGHTFEYTVNTYAPGMTSVAMMECNNLNGMGGYTTVFVAN